MVAGIAPGPDNRWYNRTMLPGDLTNGVKGLSAHVLTNHPYGDGAELLSGARAVLERLDVLAAKATTSMCSVVPEAALDLARHTPAISPLLRRGVRVRLVVPTSVVSNPLALGQLRRFTEQSLEVRVHPEPPRRLLLLDGEYALTPLSLGQPGVDRTGCYLLRGALAGPCLDLWDMIWQRSRPLTGTGGRQLTAREVEVADMLAGGATDDQVSRKLGVSTRTVRKLVANLHLRMGTDSRLALGFQLAKSGLLPDGPPRQNIRMPEPRFNPNMAN
ncbi:LuxR family transcriptional regulator [Pseudonocardiaceae bacterium YIM PH 21723]|nr:LuxR family transcriptional regulator [Pseudonocardiaceae bacterium YIM PH 21723]